MNAEERQKAQGSLDSLFATQRTIRQAIASLQVSQMPSRAISLAITKLEEANHRLRDSTKEQSMALAAHITTQA